MSGMDDVVRLSDDDRLLLSDLLANATGGGPVLVAVDDIDGAVKVKTHGRWSPPIGVLTSTAAPVVDSARSNRDDEREEARVLRPRWGVDRPDRAEYSDLDGRR